jgi:hypothetical protein
MQLRDLSPSAFHPNLPLPYRRFSNPDEAVADRYPSPHFLSCNHELLTGRKQDCDKSHARLEAIFYTIPTPENSPGSESDPVLE